MSVWGKIIGGTTGFALGGPLGALLGVMAGHGIDKAKIGKNKIHITQMANEHQNKFLQLV